MTTTLSLEDMLALGEHHLEHSADKDGRTYFNVFLTSPAAEAVTDWPDFVDIPARYWETAAMVQSITGRDVQATARLRKWLFSHFEADGMAYRPDSPISEHVAELFDQSRLICALATWTMYKPGDKEVKDRLASLLDGIMKRATYQDDYAYIEKIGLYFGGTLIRGIVQAGLVLHRKDWIEFAGKLSRGIANHSKLIAADGAFKDHVHGALCAIGGILSYAIVSGDKALLARAEAGYKYAVSISTSFGFVPELAQKDDDMIACETCTVMDYLDVAMLLARHVNPAYWDIVEKVSRNHLWECQVRDASWLAEDPKAEDVPGEVLRRNLREKLLGSFAGWSAPHCLLAYQEYQWESWVRTEGKKPLYINKVRAMQGCCSASGIRATYQVWSNVITRDKERVSLNINLDRRTEDVDVTSYLPFEGRIAVSIKRTCEFHWRVPGHCRPGDIQVSPGNISFEHAKDGFAYFGKLAKGTVLEITFPLPESTESVVIGNTGFQQYHFDVKWKGDTVTDISPDPANGSTGHSRVMSRKTATSYGTKGIGPIYQREKWDVPARDISPAKLSDAPVLIDWYSLTSGV